MMTQFPIPVNGHVDERENLIAHREIRRIRKKSFYIDFFLSLLLLKTNKKKKKKRMSFSIRCRESAERTFGQSK